MRRYSGVSSDFLRALCEEAMRRTHQGYYDGGRAETQRRHISLVDSIMRCTGNAIISELKRASPSVGTLARGLDVRRAVSGMMRGGAVGISILTAPERFEGSLSDLEEARRHASLPILMKDVVVSQRQIEAAARLGADAILLIYRAFKRGYTELSLHEAIKTAHDAGLEVLLEACGRDELIECLKTDAEMLGVNARDLSTLAVDKRLHEEAVRGLDHEGRILVAESGIEGAEDIRRLRSAGYKAFLVGTAVMRSGDIEAKVRELVKA